MNKILGVKIDAINKEDFKKNIIKFIAEKKFHQIATVNPEFLVDAQKNTEFKNVLNNTTLNIIDGFGLQLAYYLKYKIFPDRLPGVDMVEEIFSLGQKNNYSVFLLGSTELSLKLAKAEIKKKYPQLKIYALAGGSINKIADSWQQTDDIITTINLNQPDILLVGLGHPKQEIWIYDHKYKLKTVKVAIGVGGTFDYLSKQVKRAPLLYRQFGLEWLYRLYQQPWRWRRIIKAVFIFLYLFITKHEKTNS